MSRLAPAFVIVTAMVASGGCGPRALDWNDEDGYRWADLRVSGDADPGLERLDASETGIDFANTVTEEQYIENSHYLNGSGVATGDMDGDGWVDVYFASMDGPNALYRNLGGWDFEEIADEAGVAAPGRFSTGAAFADVDGDGDLDLLVTALGGPNALYLNDGTGHFTDSTEAAGLTSTLGSMSMALADIDGDTDLDLYVVNNKLSTVQDLFPPETLQPSNIYRRVGPNEFEVLPEFQEHYTLGEIEGGAVPRLELAEPDRMYVNDGTGRFSPVSFTDGAFLDEDGVALTEAPREWGLAVRFQDMDGDGDPDLYVCNDFHSPDHIWINDGTGRFQALGALALRNTAFASMGVDFTDADRDGDLDFFLVEMLSRDHRRRMRQLGGGEPDPPFSSESADRPQKPRNTFYLNRGDGTFAEAAHYAGLEASEWSWGSLFVDVDLDGYEDLLVGTGHFYDAMDKDAARRTESVDWRRRVTVFPALRTRNVAFRNRGDLTFEEVGEDWGFAGDEDISHGMASADLDNDGDLDLVTNRLGLVAGVYENRGSGPRVAVRLLGSEGNSKGIGATVRLLSGPVAVQMKEMVAGGSYLSGSEALVSFAAGDDEMTIEVVWRNGRVSRVTGVRADRLYEISEAASSSTRPTPTAERPADASFDAPLFEDVSDRLGHTHSENRFDDFFQQPLVPFRLSQAGPGVAWTDVDEDGWVDVLVGGGSGSGISYLRNDGNGGFESVRDGTLARASDGDYTGLAVVPGTNPILVAGTASYDRSASGGSSATAIALGPRGARVTSNFADFSASTGPLASADYDGDGDLDLFVGGRAIPGRYPMPASSRFFTGDGRSFRLDDTNSASVDQIGMVSGAVFSDVDADGDPDLLLAIEWGPIRLLVNEGGRFEDATERFGLSAYTGWWNGVTTGDLNADGRPDIIATNRGLNTQFDASPERPATAFHADLDNDGRWDVLEARYDERLRAMVPIRGLLTLYSGLPFLQGQVPGFTQYGELTLSEIVRRPVDALPRVEATTLAHMVFLSTPDGFRAERLPVEAQLAPAFHAGVADLDGDGHEDVFLSQNLFAVRSEVNRDDAGRGLWLRGDGNGSLSPVSGSRSGIKVYGEQRGAAFADYDRDGRVDLIVTQNNAETKLYRNIGARPGLRVRLVGPTSNPEAIGGAIRLRYGDDWGPLREIHAGSGYWSQDETTQVLGLADTPTAVWVRWPGGAETVTELDDAIPDFVSIDASGSLVVVSSDGP